MFHMQRIAYQRLPDRSQSDYEVDSSWSELWLVIPQLFLSQWSDLFENILGDNECNIRRRCVRTSRRPQFTFSSSQHSLLDSSQLDLLHITQRRMFFTNPTNSIEQSSSWVDSRSTVQDISRHLLNPKIQNCVYNSATRIPVLSRINPVHIVTT
jgi:hypothetical protein